MKGNVSFKQELVIAAVMAITGLFIIVMTWSGFYAVAKDHPTVHLFLLGQGLLLLAVGRFSSVRWRRSWIRSMEELRQDHDDRDAAQ